MPRRLLNADRPRYPHDCTACQFLGRFDYKDSPTDLRWHYDLYYCPSGLGGTVLARWGKEGPKYSSLMLVLLVGLGTVHAPLWEAARRQIQWWQARDKEQTV